MKTDTWSTIGHRVLLQSEILFDYLTYTIYGGIITDVSIINTI